MKYFANASSLLVRERMVTGKLGMMATPAEGRDPGALKVLDEDGEVVERPARHWAGDNGCYGEGYPGDDAWLGWLVRHQAHADRCWFATAPDVVGDAAATLVRSAPFLPLIRQIGYPAALVAQNGLTPEMVPWDAIDVLFLGGSTECLPCGYVKPIEERKRKHCPRCYRPLTEWKLSAAARALTSAAKHRGLLVHMGRVNSSVRFIAAALSGCDSCDGTFVAFGPDKNLVRMGRWDGHLAVARRQRDAQLGLFGAAS